MLHNKNTRISPLAITALGYAIIPVTVNDETVWCIRTRQDIPKDILAQSAPQMILQDPQSVIPSGQNDLPFTYLVQLAPNNVKRITKLTDKLRFRTIGFARDTFFGVTKEGALVTTPVTGIVSKNPNQVEYTKLDMLGLPNDAEVMAILAIPTDTGIRLLVGATTTKTNCWLYEAFIDQKDTRVIELKPIEGQFRQVVGLRLNDDGNAILLATGDGTVWGAPNNGKTYDFTKIYGFHVNRPDDLLGYDTELTVPAPRASQTGRA